VINQITDGRKHFVFEYVGNGDPVNSQDSDGVPLIQWCAYYRGVSAIGFLLLNGESLQLLVEGKDSQFGLEMLGLIRPDSPESIQS